MFLPRQSLLKCTLAGTIRYFRIQNTLMHGIFPASLYGVAGLSFIMGALITIVFGLLVAGAT